MGDQYEYDVISLPDDDIDDEIFNEMMEMFGMEDFVSFNENWQRFREENEDATYDDYLLWELSQRLNAINCNDNDYEYIRDYLARRNQIQQHFDAEIDDREEFVEPPMSLNALQLAVDLGFITDLEADLRAREVYSFWDSVQGDANFRRLPDPPPGFIWLRLPLSEARRMQLNTRPRYVYRSFGYYLFDVHRFNWGACSA